MFKFLILISALLIASTAAFFSVTGLGQLFAGAFIPVLIMAGALELGKLVTASFLTRYWLKLTGSLRVYYGIATVVLILITSAGIYGFLSNAYQQTAFNVETTETQVQLYEGRKSAVQSDIDRFEERIEILNQQRTTQQEQYKELTDGEDWVNASRVFTQIERSDSTINVLNDQITEKRQEMLSIDSLLVTARAEDLETAREIGGFRFIAANFNTDTDTVVKWFIFIIIFVFDPLAVSLVVGYNYIKVVEENEFPLKPKEKKKYSFRLPQWKLYGESTEKNNVPLEEDKAVEDPVVEEEIVEEQTETLDNSNNIPYYLRDGYDWDNDNRWKSDPNAVNFNKLRHKPR